MNQTPLMLAAMHGKIACVEILIEAGANVSKFSSSKLLLSKMEHEMEFLKLTVEISSRF